MISEIAIIKLQFLAAVFMGYEYFVSHSIKEWIDDYAKNIARNVQRESDDAIKAQITVLKKNIPYYVSAVIFLILGAISFWLVSVFDKSSSYLLASIIFAIAAIFFVIGAIKAVLDRLVVEGLAPMVIPLGKRMLTTYLLFTSKGVIAGIGMLFLLASFWARYNNALHA